MAVGSELAVQYVSLVASAKGFPASIRKELGAGDGEVSKAGERQGGLFSGGFTGALGKVGVGAAIAGAAAAAGVAAFAAKGIAEFGKFEKGMNEVFTLLPGASKETMDSLSSDVRSFVREAGVAHEEAVPALYSALSAGIPKDNVFDFLETANKAAIGGISDLDTAVSAISGPVNAYGAEILSANAASDAMFTAVKNGVTTFPELASSLSNVTPIAASLGVNFGDITGAIATMTAQGTGTAESITGIRAALVEVSKDGTKTSDIFKELSGQTFTDFIAGGGNLQEALSMIADHAADTGLSAADMFGSVEAGSAVLQLTGKNTEKFATQIDEAYKAMASGGEVTSTAFETMDRGLARSWERIKIGVTDAALGFGETLAPAVAMVADGLSTGLPKALEWVSGFLTGTVAPALTEITGGITAFGAAWTYNDGEITSSGFPGFMERVGYTARQAFDYFQSTVLPNLRMFGAYLIANVVPAVQRFASFLTGSVVPALIQLIGWVRNNTELLKNIATVIGVLLIPALVRWGIASTVSGAKSAAAWLLASTSSIRSAAVQVAQSYVIIGRWIAMGAAAVVSGAQTAYIWGLYKIEAIKGAAAYAMQSLRVAAAWVAMSTAAVLSGAKTAAVWTGTIIAQAVKGAISFGAQVVKVVAGWVLMGVQSLLQAARMAAAWLIAMGPIGWVTAAVIAIVALVIANWDKIKAATVRIWGAIVKWVTDAWNNIKTAVSLAITWVRDWVINKMVELQNRWNTIWNAVTSIASSIWNGIKTLISAAINWVVNWIATKMNEAQSRWNTVWNAIKSIASSVWDAIKSSISNAINWVRNLIDTTMNTIKSLWSGAWEAVRNTVSGVWDRIKTLISNAWTNIKSTLNTLIDFVKEKPAAAFEAAKEGIITAWDKIKEAAKKPVRFVVETVIGGLVDTFNKIPGVNIPKPKLPPGFMKGGYTGDGAADEFAGHVHKGEYVFTKKQTEAIGKENLAAQAHAAIRGGEPQAAVGASVYGGLPSFSGRYFENIDRANALRITGDSRAVNTWYINQAADMWNGLAGVNLFSGNAGPAGIPSIRAKEQNVPFRPIPNWAGYFWDESIWLNPGAAYMPPTARRTLAAHEVGHALGLPHAMATGAYSIMNYDSMYKANRPTNADAAALRAIYGPPGPNAKASSMPVGDAFEAPDNPFTGLIDTLMKKIKEAFPDAGMFVDVAGGIAKSAIEQVTKTISDIKDGVKNIATDVFSKVKNFFGGGAAMVPTLHDSGGILPPGNHLIANRTRKPEAIFTNEQAKALVSNGGNRGGDTHLHVENLFGSEDRVIGKLHNEIQRGAISYNLRQVARV